jgi:archaellum component FlaC
MKFCLFILLFFTTFSCAHREELKSLAEVSSDLEKVEKSIKRIDQSSIIGKSDSLTNLFKKVKDNYKTDTIDPTFSSAMNSLKQTRRFYRKAQGKLSAIADDVIKVRLALSNLKKDITSKAGNPKKYAEFINFEAKKVNKLSINFEEFKKNLDTNYFYFQKNTTFINQSLK